MREEILLASLGIQANFNLAKFQILLESYQSVEQAWEDNFQKLDQKHKWVKKLDRKSLLEIGQNLQDKIIAHKIKLLSFFDPCFPKGFRSLADCPVVIYFQGDLKALSHQTVSVVGARRINPYAKKVMAELLPKLVQLKVSLVSGLALGVDTLAHQICLDYATPTIGVVGSGLNQQVFYPPTNWTLKNQILEKGGLVMSEYPPDFASNVFTFPKRNRLLASLSPLTLVVQASVKSGSLITAGVARDLGQTVATIPASIFDPEFAGNIKLIKDGANVVTTAEDLLQLIGLNNHQIEMRSHQPSQLVFQDEFQKKVYEALDFEPKTLAELVEQTNFDLQLVQAQLSLLELEGLVFTSGENMWQKV